MTPRLVRPTYFVWIIVLIGLWMGYAVFGLPHAIWAYQYIERGHGVDPWARRIYTSCTFIGPYGAFTQRANNGACGWIIFRKNGGAA